MKVTVTKESVSNPTVTDKKNEDVNTLEKLKTALIELKDSYDVNKIRIIEYFIIPLVDPEFKNRTLGVQRDIIKIINQYYDALLLNKVENEEMFLDNLKNDIYNTIKKEENEWI